MTPIFHPEDHARAKIDASLAAAGWEQAARYMAGARIIWCGGEGQVRFEYVASGTEILFRCGPVQPLAWPRGEGGARVHR